MSTESGLPISVALDSWGLLRAGTHLSDVHLDSGLEIPTMPSRVYTDLGPVRFAIGQNGNARVLIPLDEQEETTTLTEGLALSMSVSSFTLDGRVLHFLDLICPSSDLETVFGEVVDEMLSRIYDGSSCVDAVRSTLEDFRSLLLRRSPMEVDSRRIAGFVSELIVLNRLLDRSSLAWKAWCGPTGNRHDFRMGSASLEVKSSLRPGMSVITINGLEQLEVPSDGSLHLLRFALEAVQGGPLNVSDLAHRALSLASEPIELRKLISTAGCTDIDGEEWNHLSFRIESESLYQVLPGFPRLVVSMLQSRVVPHGVHEITYEVDLSVARQFLCKKTALAELEMVLCS